MKCPVTLLWLHWLRLLLTKRNQSNPCSLYILEDWLRGYAGYAVLAETHLLFLRGEKCIGDFYAASCVPPLMHMSSIKACISSERQTVTLELSLIGEG